MVRGFKTAELLVRTGRKITLQRTGNACKLDFSFLHPSSFPASAADRHYHIPLPLVVVSRAIKNKSI